MKNLVMGVAAGYGWNDVEPFVNSFKKNCPNADLVLFMDNISKFTENKLNRGRVRIEPIPQNLKAKLIIDARWEMYKIFLDAHPEYEKIFVTDTRDVIFQGDLFSTYTEYKNFLVYAAEAELIKNDIYNFNQTWIRNLLGENEYQKIADKIIICCGTVYGTRAEMNILFDSMIEILKRSTAWGDEQAAMNYLVHNNLLPIKNLIASDVETGEILTAGLIKNEKISNTKILRGNGGAPAVVHQYNRKQSLNQLAIEIYREKIFQPDKNFTDVQSALDQIICLVQRQNFSAATKFFINHVAYAENLTPYGDKLLRLATLIFLSYNPDAEILFSALQSTVAIAFIMNVNATQFEEIYALCILSERNCKFVNSSLKFFVKSMLTIFADDFCRNNQQDLAKKYIERLKDWRD